MTRKERKTAIENMAEDFMNLGNKGKTMVVLMQTAYNEGKTAGKREERAKWERKPASEEEMQTILISILTAAITTKIIATYYFKKIDGYVEKMCEMTLKSNEKTVAIILHKLQENFELED